ncbi:hypothetical protein [Vibrio europaeus]|uniref:hypothetical protein n=1 Tax=Vibrio europaeus TaxID=300876 RepID=UPI00233E6D5D|nr:hypothetical protein [Vibrio europaeus]MDC5853790.1 hypothetical protein [Vibrio europaeus]
MKPLVYEMDAWSMATLPQLLGASLSLQPLLAMTQSDVPVLQVPFVVGDAVFELSNEWYTTPQGHDFHLPILRPMEGLPTCYRAQQDGAASSLAVIEAIEILRRRSRDAEWQHGDQGGWAASDETLIYDWGLNLLFTDGSALSLVTEDDRIDGGWVVTPDRVRPSYQEEIWLIEVDIRERIA